MERRWKDSAFLSDRALVASFESGLVLFNFHDRCVSELLRTWLMSLSLFPVGDFVSNLISSCVQLPRRYALIRAPRITMIIIWLHLSPHIHFPTISESTPCFHVFRHSFVFISALFVARGSSLADHIFSRICSLYINPNQYFVASQSSERFFLCKWRGVSALMLCVCVFLSTAFLTVGFFFSFGDFAFGPMLWMAFFPCVF